jgi:hypothetical protein
MALKIHGHVLWFVAHQDDAWRIIKTKRLMRLARRDRIADAGLREAIERAALGSVLPPQDFNTEHTEHHGEGTEVHRDYTPCQRRQILLGAATERDPTASPCLLRGSPCAPC